jgi:hypothetical protein
MAMAAQARIKFTRAQTLLVMAGLVPPARAEALQSDVLSIASAGEGPAIYVLVVYKFVDARPFGRA